MPRIPVSAWVLWFLGMATPVFYFVVWALNKTVRNSDLPELLLLPPVFCIMAAWRTRFSVWLKIVLAIVTSMVSFIGWIIGGLVGTYAVGGY